MNSIHEFKTISSTEYLLLKAPQFIAQTRISTAGIYYTCWKSEGELYKVKNNIQY